MWFFFLSDNVFLDYKFSFFHLCRHEVAKLVSSNISEFPFLKVSIDGLRAVKGPGCLTRHLCVPCLGQIDLNWGSKEELGAQGRCKMGRRALKLEECKVTNKRWD